MFIIQNGKITSDKTLDIGKSRIINLVFKSDLSFADDDKFKLVLGSIQSENYAFVDDGCLRFTAVSLNFISSATTSAAVKIICNGNEILSDEIIIKAIVSDGGGGSADLSNYVGGVSITGDVNGSTADVLNYAKTGSLGTITVGWNNPDFVAQPNAETYNNNLFVKGWVIGIIGGNRVLLNAGGQTITVNKSQGIILDASNLSWKGNRLNYGGGLCLLNSSDNIPFYISQPYINKNDSYNGEIYFRFNSDSKIDWYTHNHSGLTFYDDGDFWFQYPDTLTKRMEDNCITKEIWVTSSVEITTISIPEYVQVVGNMPQTLQATKEIQWNGSTYNRNLTHVFVVRGINYNGKWIYTINYSYNFISDYNDIFN